MLRPVVRSRGGAPSLGFLVGKPTRFAMLLETGTVGMVANGTYSCRRSAWPTNLNLIITIGVYAIDGGFDTSSEGFAPRFQRKSTVRSFYRRDSEPEYR